MGVGRNALEHFFQRLRQIAQLAQLADVGRQLGFGRQIAVQQQVGHFFEACLSRQFANVITTIGQACTFLAHGGQGGLPGNLATQPGATQYFCFGHCSLQS
ncbi:hypothetical protein D3C78_1374460 [compost metagenome]